MNKLFLMNANCSRDWLNFSVFCNVIKFIFNISVQSILLVEKDWVKNYEYEYKEQFADVNKSL